MMVYERWKMKKIVEKVLMQDRIERAIQHAVEEHVDAQKSGDFFRERRMRMIIEVLKDVKLGAK